MQKKLEAAQSALSEVQARARAAELSAAEGVTAKQQLDQIASQLAAAKKEVDNARTNANKAQQVRHDTATR
jgi:outer membrane protein TolC